MYRKYHETLKLSKKIYALIMLGFAGCLVLSSFNGTALALDGNWTEPAPMNNPAAGWLASGCNGTHEYESGLFHIGRDYWNAPGVPVHAIGDGVVRGNFDFGAGFGRAIFVQHQAADGSIFLVLYGHINSNRQAGEQVHSGDTVGSIASISGGTHLHLGLVPGTSYPSSGWGRLPCGTTGTNGFVDPITYLAQHPKFTTSTPTTDSDNDGVIDGQDQCPNVKGATYNFGCPPPRQKMMADFNEDGKADVASFYNYHAQGSGLWTWSGDNNRKLNTPVQQWYQPTGWVADRIIPAGAGDYNGDGHQDIAAFYRYDNAALGLWIWPGNGSGQLGAPQSGWYISQDWFGERVIPAGTADYNNDGRADIAAFYRYDNAALGLKIWYGNADSSFGNPTGPWYADRDWFGERVIPAGAGDFNGDGKSDISAYYRYDGGALGLKVWYGNGAGGVYNPQSSWYVASGWSGERIMPAGVGDFNGDGRTDIASYFRYDGAELALNVWYGRADGYLDEVNRWYTPRDWFGSRLLPMGVGDIDGDGYVDVNSFYDYDSGHVAGHGWFGDGNGFGEIRNIWDQTSGWHAFDMIE